VQVSEVPHDPAAAALWSLGRSLALAVPERWGGRLDLDPDRPCDIPALLETVAWSATSGEDEAALRSGGLHVARLRRAEPPDRRTLTLNSAATYLVTGAFGGVGPLVARWLARCGAGRIVLAGRHVPDLGADGPWGMLGAELDVLGAQPVFVRCDVADPADLAQLMRTAHLAEWPLRGIWHAAAATAAGDGLDRASVAAVFAPKVEALLAIGAAARDLPLDHLVLFSSAAATLGERTRPAYAAANGFLDAFAARLRAQGRPCLSIQWGLWGGRDASHADVRFFRRAGLSEMAPDRALNAMERLIAEAGGGRRQPMVMALDGNRLWSALELTGRARFLEALAGPGPAASDATAASPRPASSPAELLESVAREVRAVLELDPGEPLDLDRGFFDLGMDSLMSVALKGRLEVLFGEALPSTLTMDYPSVRALASYFGGGGDVSGALVDPSIPSATVLEAVEEPLAVERMSDAEVLDALKAELADLALDTAE
jgi:acyl carrier protein/NADP-dependent 3-hydroxy acid dehydrogenase YdfG